MPITIGSNIASLKAQRRLGESTSKLSKVFERLSSGQRINSAADDAAGLAIAESLKSDRRVFNQGIRNFNDGFSLLTVADSAIESLSNVVVRLKELAEQSANGTYSLTQRSALDKEAQALSKEYTRIIQSTKFNNINLLDGSLGSGVRLQGGYGTDGSILSGIGGAIGTGSFATAISQATGHSTRTIINGDFNGDGYQDIVTGTTSLNILLGQGNGSFATSVSYSTGGVTYNALTASDFNGDGNLDVVTVLTNGNVGVLLGQGNGSFGTMVSYSAVSSANYVTTGDFNGDGAGDLLVGTGANEVAVLLGRGDGTFGTSFSFVAGAEPSSLVVGDFNGDGISDFAAGLYIVGSIGIFYGRGDGRFTTGPTYLNGGYSITASDLNGDGNLDLISGNAGSITVFRGSANGTFAAGVNYSTGSTVKGINTGDFNGDGIIDVVASEYGSGSFGVFLGRGDGTLGTRISYLTGVGDRTSAVFDFNSDGVTDIVSGNGFGHIDTFFGLTKDGTSPLLPFDLKTLAGARQALPIFDQKIQQLAKQRGQIGAFQSRLEVGINNLQSASENYAAAESRIRDADIAQDAADLIRLNILQKSASGILAQANLQPSLALKLLVTD